MYILYRLTIAYNHLHIRYGGELTGNGYGNFGCRTDTIRIGLSDEKRNYNVIQL